MMDSNAQNRKNAPGSRLNIGWEHGEEVDNDQRKIKCKYCNEIISGNIYRFKHHLACTKENVKACNNVPVKVKEQMFKLLKESSKRKMTNDEEKIVESVSHKRGKNVTESFSNRIIGNTQSTPNQNFEKRLRDEACRQIARFFHTSGIPFSCAKNPKFAKIFELVGKCGSEFVPPPYHELENFSAENEMKNMLEEYKYEWKKTGCSIICDEWTNMKGIFYCKFLVNSPMGTILLKTIDTSDFSETTVKVFKVLDEIVEKVGEENVVQVITNNAANYEAAMDMLIEKRKRIFQRTCAVQLLDGILRDFENLSHHQKTIAKGKKISTFIYSRIKVISFLRNSTNGKELTGPTTTSCATAYLTLLYLIDMKDHLMTLLEWDFDEEVKEIQQILQDFEFWDDIIDCVNVALPIIEVLLKIDFDEKPTMGFIYKEIIRAKVSIQSLHNAKGYESIWEIVKERFFSLLCPFDLASYYLNPQLCYGPTLEIGEIEKDDATILKILNLLNCDLLEMTDEKLRKVKHQLTEFVTPTGLFATQEAILDRHKKDPAVWWDLYGNDCPELQRIAIRLLSLTCSSCGSGQIQNTYEQVYPKKKSPSYHKKLNDLFFVIQNFKSNIQQARTKTFEGINVEVSFANNELIIEKEAGELSGAKKDMPGDVDVSEGVSLPKNYNGNEVDTLLHNIQPQNAAPSGASLFENYNGNEVDILLHNIQPQNTTSGVCLLENYNGNKVDTLLHNTQLQSAATANSPIYSDINFIYHGEDVCASTSTFNSV